MKCFLSWWWEDWLRLQGAASRMRDMLLSRYRFMINHRIRKKRSTRIWEEIVHSLRTGSCRDINVVIWVWSMNTCLTRFLKHFIQHSHQNLQKFLKIFHVEIPVTGENIPLHYSVLPVSIEIVTNISTRNAYKIWTSWGINPPWGDSITFSSQKW